VALACLVVEVLSLASACQVVVVLSLA